MARVRATGMEALEQKIEKAQEKVIRTKKAHEKAVEELQELLDKQAAFRTDEIMKAITNSSKTYEEIMKFINAE
ncbi:MAG: hypothetical protein IJ526_01960 [Lachnospiraceae bacterium]|nr:hypothetical protein [Lachnospiraceae bacterium]